MAMIEDFTAFFNVSEFASDATLGGIAVRGIFDQAYDHAGVGLSGMSSNTPAFTLPTSSVPAGPVGMVLVVNAVTYMVAEHQPDGSGLSVLLLERTA